MSSTRRMSEAKGVMKGSLVFSLALHLALLDTCDKCMWCVFYKDIGSSEILTNII